MKRILLPLVLAIVIGLLYGKVVFDQYHKELKEVLSEDEKIYVFQQGVYSSAENVAKYTKNVNYYIVEEDKPYFRVYVAITKNADSVDKLKGVFTSNGNDIYVRELNNNNLTFLEVLNQYDQLLNATTKTEEILQIEKQVISKYEELVLRND